MTRIREVSRGKRRVVYPVSYCPQTYHAMQSLQARLEESSGTYFSISVIARSLGFMAASGADTSVGSRLMELCQQCASKGAKSKKPAREDASHA